MSPSSSSASFVAEAPSATVLSPSVVPSPNEMFVVVIPDLDLPPSPYVSTGVKRFAFQGPRSSFNSGLPSNCSVVLQSRG